MAESEGCKSGYGMFAVQPPPNFDFDRTSEWPTWSQQFDDYRFASGLNERGEEAQVRTLLYTMGKQARQIFQTFALSDDDAKKYEVVKQRFDNHFVAARNLVYESACFHRRVQEPGESVDQFVTALHTLADRCEYQEFKERMVRDRFIVGLSDSKLSETLQMDASLTLASALAKARLKETVHRQQQQLRDASNEATAAGNLDAVRKQGQPTERDGPPRRFTSQATGRDGGKCSFCGKDPHARTACPARSTKCSYCRSTGHFAAVCRKKAAAYPRKVRLSCLQKNNDAYFVGSVSGAGSNARFIQVFINETPVFAKVDSGAEVSVVPSTFPGLPSRLQKSDITLTGPSNECLKVLGKFTATIQWRRRTVQQTVYVVSRLHSVLLGLPAIEALGVIKFVDLVTPKQSVEACYPHLFRGLGAMAGEYQINLKPNSVPFAIHTARRVPLPLRNAVKQELERMERNGVIRKVNEPTDWCAGIVPVLKPSGAVRICVDLTHLNKCVRRERYVLPTVDDSMGMLSGATVFSKIDANSGFHQVKLSRDSELLTTFITPFGRFCFQRLPFGITSAPEYFQKRMAQILEGIPGVINLMDDILIFGKDRAQHDDRLRQTLDRLGRAGVTLNKDKCCFGVTEISFLGFQLSHEGIKPDPEKVRAIKELKTPENVSEVRRLLGMANHLARFIPNLASKTEPLRQLLLKDSEWVWGPAQEQSLAYIKDVICSPRVMANYDVRYPTILSADASSFGLGAVLLQIHPNKERRPVAFASRSLTPAESRYAQIEKEALALTWAAERFEGYITGLDVVFETDHKPLVTLLGKSPIDLLPPRIQRFRMRLMRFNFVVEYVPGTSVITADVLSRAPLRGTPACSHSLTVSEVTKYVEGCVPGIIEHNCFERVKKAQEKDEVCRSLIDLSRKGWPKFSSVPMVLRPYWQERSALTVCEGVLLKGRRLVIPQELRNEVLQQLHEGHQGIGKCRARAQESVWWPGLSSQLGTLIANCTACAEHREQNSEPMIPTETPQRPWQKVGVDLCQIKGSHYLVAVDYFSRYPELALLTSLTSASVILHLKSFFSRHGIPEIVVSDNGSQFVSGEFKLFAREYGFRSVTSSPRYPQANGEVERMVKTIKTLIIKARDPYISLLAYRDTPGPLGKSPAELLMGRRLRTTLPLHPRSLLPRELNLNKVRGRDQAFREKQRRQFNRRHAARELPPLRPGVLVWVKDYKQKATVLHPANRPRSFVVETHAGVLLERNRKMLVLLSPQQTRSEGTQGSYELPENREPSGEDRSATEVLGGDSTGSDLPENGRIQPPLPTSPYVSRYGRKVRKPERYEAK